jgi:activator of HSP90 ATPase
MWEFLLSETGINIWLGEINIDDFELQKRFVTKAGIEGKLTVFVPDCHLRFKWKLSSWEKPSTVELRVRNSKGCKYRLKSAQVHRLKSEQLSDVKIPFPLIYAS